jgi:hypothetical protein
LLHAVETSGLVRAGSTNDAGEYYSMAMASIVTFANVKESAIIIVPLSAPRAEEVLDFTFLASADCMYFQLHKVPQPRCTYGHCAAYSADAPYRPVEVSAVFKFPSIENYVVASAELAAAVRAARGAEVDLPLQQAQDKRQRIRQPEELGELTDEAGSRPKGMSMCS